MPMHRALLIAAIASSPLAAQVDYHPLHKLPNGKEIVAVYVGAQTCGPCLLPEVKDAVRYMKDKVAVQAFKQKAAFSAVGVAQDWEIRVAAEFLQPLGPWDQTVLGGNWTNLAVEQYMLRDSTARLAMPQI